MHDLVYVTMHVCCGPGVVGGSIHSYTFVHLVAPLCFPACCTIIRQFINYQQ